MSHHCSSNNNIRLFDRYALLSNPNEDCNPTAHKTYGDQNGAIVVVAIISTVILLYCVTNGTKILNIFNPEGEGVMMSYAEKKAQADNTMALNAVLTGEDQQQKDGSSSSSAPTTAQPVGVTTPGATPAE